MEKEMQFKMECMKTIKVPETSRKAKHYVFKFTSFHLNTTGDRFYGDHKLELEGMERDENQLEDVIDVVITLDDGK